MIAGGASANKRNKHNDPHAGGQFIWANDFLKLCIDMLPHEVELCKELLEFLRCSGGAYSQVLDGHEVKSVTDVLSKFTADQPSNHNISKIGEKLNSVIHAGGMHTRNHKKPEHLQAGHHHVGGDHHEGVGDKALAVKTKRLEGDAGGSAAGGGATGDPGSPTAILKSFSTLFPRHGWLPDASLGVRRRIFSMMDDSAGSNIGKIIAGVMIATIAVSTVSFVAESLPRFRHTPVECWERQAAGLKLTAKACEPRPDEAFFSIEAVCISIFTLDYLLRVGTVHTDVDSVNGEVRASGLARTLRYMKEPLNIVDLLAILPFYIDQCISDGTLGFVRVLRLCRILRPFKLAKHNRGLQMFVEVMTLSGQPLLLLLFFNAMLVVFLGSLVFFCEVEKYSVAAEYTGINGTGDFPTGVWLRHDKQYEGYEVSPFRSIPYAFWFVCVTMTTVGYGDYTPTTWGGKLVAVFTFYVGIVFLALPIGILSQNFELVYERFCESQGVADFDPEGPPRMRDHKRQSESRVAALFMGNTWFPNVGCFRRNVFLLFHEPLSGKMSAYVGKITMGTILLSIVTFVLETMPEFKYTPAACTPTHLSVEDCTPKLHDYFYSLEVFCVAIFTFDWLVRVSLVHAADPLDVLNSLESTKLSVKYPKLSLTKTYCCQRMNLVDFLSVAPFYFELAAGGGMEGLAVIRVVRLVRLFRLLKSPKLRLCFDLLVNVIADAMPALMTLFFVTTLMCVLFASCICFAESSFYSLEHFPEVNNGHGVYVRPTADGAGVEISPYTSIPYAFWWFFVTSTTVGYGDDYPTTTGGRIVTVFAFYLGIVLLALPLSIIGQSFNKFYPEWIHTFEEVDDEADSKKTLRLSSPVTLFQDGEDRGKEAANSDSLRTTATPDGGVTDIVEIGQADEDGVEGQTGVLPPDTMLENCKINVENTEKRADIIAPKPAWG